MKTQWAAYQQRASGHTLLLVIMLMLAATITVIGVLSYSQTQTNFTARNNQLAATTAAAEATTEKIVSQMAYDFLVGGDSEVARNLNGYRRLQPSSAESDYWSNWEFDSHGRHTTLPPQVALESSRAYTNLDSTLYRELRGFTTTYSVIANARKGGARFDITSGVRQQVQLAEIPIFQFAIFYNLPLEVGASLPFTIAGRVHANSDIYAAPNRDVTFAGDVTATGDILNQLHPLDDMSAGSGAVNFLGRKEAHVSPLNIPIGTSNSSPEVLRGILLDPPPASESPMTAAVRYYNKADLIIAVTNAGVQIVTGPSRGHSRFVPSNEVNLIINTTNLFLDARGTNFVHPVDIDVGAFGAWSTTNSTIFAPNLIYVVDQRTLPADHLAAVRVYNGRRLPAAGLTIATAQPIYVWGHYNQPNPAFLGTANTTGTSPASFVGDAVTILSENWLDSRSIPLRPRATRPASDTTVNAAILCGIVETATYRHHSGGVHNLTRFLEDWFAPSATLTYNGSVVVLFPSRYANSAWNTTAYRPPFRNWTFDLNFTQAGGLPPGTPSVTAVIRSRWNPVEPNTTNIVATY